MTKEEWIECMKECKYQEFVEVKSPKFFQGFRVICGLDGSDCERCEFYDKPVGICD